MLEEYYQQNQDTTGQAMLQEAEERRDQDQGSVEGEFESGGQDCELGADDYELRVVWLGYMKLTMSQLQDEFRAVQAIWNQSRECQTMLAQLKSLKTAATSPITNIVALGIGSLHEPPDETPGKSALQLAALLTVRDFFSGKPTPRHVTLQC